MDVAPDWVIFMDQNYHIDDAIEKCEAMAPTTYDLEDMAEWAQIAAWLRKLRDASCHLKNYISFREEDDNYGERGEQRDLTVEEIMTFLDGLSAPDKEDTAEADEWEMAEETKADRIWKIVDKMTSWIELIVAIGMTLLFAAYIIFLIHH